MSDKRNKNYEVGYGRPPKKNQFKKGHSGNQKGRPKQRHDIVSTLDRTLSKAFIFREGDNIREMSAEQALIRTQVLKAMQGDQTAFNAVMKQARRCGLILPRQNTSDKSIGGILLMPDPMSLEEWEKMAAEQQAPHRSQVPPISKSSNDNNPN